MSVPPLNTPKNLTDLADKAKQAELKAQRKAEFEAKFKKPKEEQTAAKGKDGDKSKADLRAERRAKQEAQRAAKATAGDAKPVSKTPAPNAAQTTNNKQNSAVTPAVKETSPEKVKQTTATTQLPADKVAALTSQLANVRIFSHLPQRASDLNSINTSSIPPSVVNVGYKINQDSFKGATAKCIAMLTAFKQVVRDYVNNSDKKDLKHQLNTLLFVDCVKFLSKCRPLSIAMDNSLKNLKLEFTRIPSDQSDEKVRKEIIAAIDKFLSDDILRVFKPIIERIVSKVDDEDTLMTFGYSTLIRNGFISAWKSGKKFNVIVVDSRPKLEGEAMLADLVKAGIPTTYCLINAISYFMPSVTRVFVEAHALLGNGYVMSHLGVSQIALVAKQFNVQFLVCCETFKFSDRVHTDSFVHNELGNEREFFNSLPAHQRPKIDELNNLHILDMLYDLTPHELVTTIITEKTFMPSISVPNILRIRESK